MAVNFADIGWADWIIAPEAFDAYFCAGRCPFPLPNSLGWTNHAFLQSLVRSLGQDEVPAPCCAPSALSDLTLLYNDNSVVVLRRFPKMTVLSCSCQ
ncbi:protein dbl-1-like [Schistocerca piceifrons]|nr:protein dbl-1-like [Schistocerca piceifrons]